jgi:hypothetical protein
MSEFGIKSCVKIVGRFKQPDGKPFTLYSRDEKKHPGNVYYWMNYFETYVTTGKWKGKVKEYAIYRLVNGKIEGDPLVKDRGLF